MPLPCSHTRSIVLCRVDSDGYGSYWQGLPTGMESSDFKNGTEFLSLPADAAQRQAVLAALSADLDMRQALVQVEQHLCYVATTPLSSIMLNWCLT